MKKVLVVLIALLCLVGITNAQSKFGVSVQGAASLPMGDFEKIVKMGMGGLATVTYDLGNNLELVGTTGYVTYSQKDIIIFGATITGSTSLIPAIAGIRYYFAPKNFRPYVTAQGGLFLCSVKAEAMGISNSDSKSYFGFHGGGGFLYKLGNKMDLDVNAIYGSVSDISYVTIAAGLHFAL